MDNNTTTQLDRVRFVDQVVACGGDPAKAGARFDQLVNDQNHYKEMVYEIRSEVSDGIDADEAINAMIMRYEPEGSLEEILLGLLITLVDWTMEERV